MTVNGPKPQYLNMRTTIHRLLIPLLFLVTGLTSAAQQWAMPKVSVAILRSEPRHSSEQVSQVVMGTPLKVLEGKGDWWKIKTPEGYSGYVRSNTLKGLDDSSMAKWRKSQRAVVYSDKTVYATSEMSVNPDAPRLTDLVNGSILEVVSGTGTGPLSEIRLPDGRRGYIDSSLLMPIKDWASQKWNPEDMPAYARRLMGAPYVWGGTSTKGMDCSGLTQICAYRNGVMLPRDASQQVNVGMAVDKNDPTKFQSGDLLFFGNVKTGRVTHVAISLGGPAYIHSSARVRISSLDKSAPDYENPGLIAVRRIDTATARRLSLLDHPWYF